MGPLNQYHSLLRGWRAFATAVLFTGCTRSAEDPALAAQIGRAFEPVRTMTTGYRVLDLERLAPFPWDRGCFFDGEDQVANISAKIGFAWAGGPVPDLCRRLLFVRGKHVVCYADFAQSNTYEPRDGTLPLWLFECPGSGAYGVSRQEARFASFGSATGG